MAKTEYMEQETSRYRHYGGPLGKVARILAVVLPIYGLLYILDIFTDIGIFIYSGSHNAIFLSFVLALVFILVPATSGAPRDRMPWYDIVLLGAGLIGTFYLALNYERVLMHGGASITTGEIIIGLVTILILGEALRRTIGWPMIIIAAFFMVHAKLAYLFPGPLHGPNFTWGRLMSFIYLSDQGIFGTVLGIASTTILVFLVFGSFLSVSGASRFFLDLAMALMGHLRGGPAKVSIIGSALLGTLTGSPVANVGITGTITIPLMKSSGYRPEFAGAVETVASTGGAIMPPVMGAVAFIMADLSGLGYAKIATAAAIPAILYFWSLYSQVDFEAVKLGLAGLPREQLPSLPATLRQGWPFLLPLVLLVILLIGFQYDPIKAVIFSLVLLIGLSMLRPETRLSWSKAVNALQGASYGMLDMGVLCAVAGIIIGSVTLTGLGINLSRILIDFSGGSLLILTLLTAAACYVLGMGVSAVVSYVLLAALVVPAMIQAGTPDLVAHFFVFYMGLSTFITPPYAIAAFVAASIAGASAFRIGFQAMRLGIVCYLVPLVIVFNPVLMLLGSPGEIALASITAATGVYFLAAGIEGYLLRPASWWERILFLAGGVLMFIPGLSTDVPGLLLLVVGTGWQWLSRRRGPSYLMGAKETHF